MKKFKRITSGIIALSILASSTIMCMTSCSGGQNVGNIDCDTLGFENNYGINTWIEFRGKSFEDPNDAYVYAYNDYATLTFNNGILKQERWNRNGDNKGEYYSPDNEYGGFIWHTDNYQIIDNNNIQLNDYRGSATLTITDKEICGKIPLVTFDFTTYYSENTSEGDYIPADYIDWSRSPEKETEIVTPKSGIIKPKTGSFIRRSDEPFEREIIKYYILPEYLN